MTKSQSGIITQCTRLLELVYSCNQQKDNYIFNDEMSEALIIAICSMQALHRSLKRDEIKNNIVNLPTSKN